MVRYFSRQKERTANMAKIQNLQDVFLNQARTNKQQVTVFLVNGFQLRGMVTGFVQMLYRSILAVPIAKGLVRR